MILQYFAAAFTILIISVIMYFKWCFTYWEKKNVYTQPPSIPFGNASKAILLRTHIATDLRNFYNHLRAKGLKYGGYYFLGKPIFVVADINLIRNILSKDFQHFVDHPNYVNEKIDPLSGHLFSLRGAKWKALRIKLTPTFTSGKIKAMFQTLVDCTKELSAIIGGFNERSEPVDIKEVFGRYATDIIGSCAFGIECNSLRNPNTEFRKYGKKFFEPEGIQILKDILGAFSPELLLKLNIPLTNKDVESFFMGLVKNTVEFREKNNYSRKDFMQLLIEMKSKALTLESKSRTMNGGNTKNHVDYYQDGFSLEEIAAQVFVFFLAGFETSSTTLTYFMYELSTHPDIQDKLREEIKTVLAKHDHKITYDAIMEMTYLDQCIYETLRKYPPVPLLSRDCTKTYRVPDSNLVIEKGTTILIPNWGIHYDPEFYPNPEKFEPKRFSETNRGKRPPFTFLSFGEGPRICIGLRFGILQTKVGLVAMLRDYKFSLNPKTHSPLKFNAKHVLLTPEGGVWVDPHKV